MSNYKDMSNKEYIEYSATKHGGKLTGIDSVSTDRRQNCNCAKYRTICGSVCAGCYVTNHEYKSNLMRKLARNHDFYTNTEIMPEDIPNWKTKFGRFESFADLNNELQFKNYCTIAKYNPNTDFAIWTKNPNIIKSAIEKYGDIIPDNMNIIYSSLMINFPADPFIIKRHYPFVTAIFTVYTKEYAQEHGIVINCGARACIPCGLCYHRHDRNAVLIINELYK